MKTALQVGSPRPPPRQVGSCADEAGGAAARSGRCGGRRASRSWGAAGSAGTEVLQKEREHSTKQDVARLPRRPETQLFLLNKCAPDCRLLQTFG